MTYKRDGVDNIRKVWSKKERESCESMPQRTKIAQRIIDNTLDFSKAYISYSPGAFKIDRLIKDAKIAINKTPWIENKGGKSFMRRDFLNQEDLTVDSSYMQFVLSPEIISIVTTYMGHVPLLHYVQLFHSKYVSDDLMESQLYHCDWLDVRQIKIFLYISDTDEDNGALTILPPDVSQKIRDSGGYTYGGAGYRISDDDMNKECSVSENQIVLAGPAGSVFFADTCKCFHYGSRVKPGHERLIFYVDFISPAAININPNRKNNSPFRYMDSDKLNIYQKHLIGAKGTL